MKVYSDEQIRAAMILLDNIETHGIENAKRVVMLQNILEQGEAKSDGGNEHC